MSTSPLQMNLDIPCSAEFVGVVRLAISGVATRMNFNIEEIEDIKISVSEACTNVIQHAYATTDSPNNNRIYIQSSIYEDYLEITVKDTGEGFDMETIGTHEQKEKSHEKFGLGLGLTFIKSLMDDTSFSSQKGKGTTIKMIKKVPVLED
jgi:serine/threonine-protein kinase RsbW